MKRKIAAQIIDGSLSEAEARRQLGVQSYQLKGILAPLLLERLREMRSAAPSNGPLVAAALELAAALVRGQEPPQSAIHELGRYLVPRLLP